MGQDLLLGNYVRTKCSVKPLRWWRLPCHCENLLLQDYCKSIWLAHSQHPRVTKSQLNFKGLSSRSVALLHQKRGPGSWQMALQQLYFSG